jgi:hypothetical protein
MMQAGKGPANSELKPCKTECFEAYKMLWKLNAMEN